MVRPTKYLSSEINFIFLIIYSMQTAIWTRPDGTKFRADPRRIHTYSGCTIEYREPTEDEIKELRIPTVIVTILIPQMALFKAPSLEKKLDQMIKLYDGLERVTRDWMIHLGNINIDDLALYVTKEEYNERKGVWVTFDPADKLEALYSDKKKNEEPSA